MQKLLVYGLGIWPLLVVLFGCTGVGVYQPEATETAFQATLQAMQDTITALETGQASAEQPALESSPVMLVVTATSTPHPSNTPSPLPTDRATSTLTAPSPRTPTISSQGETIVVVATPTPISTLPLATVIPAATAISSEESLNMAPLILEPENGTVVEEGRNILLRWAWEGSLMDNQHFDLKIRPDGDTASAYVTWGETDSFAWQANLRPGRYYWSVQVIQGYYKGGIQEPENRVFEAFLGPESESRLIIVGEKPDDSPVSTSQADPLHPALYWGIIMGGLAFVGFVRSTKRV